MNRLELYQYKSAAAQIGEQAAQQEHTIGSTMKSLGKGALMAGAAFALPGLASKGFGAMSQKVLGKVSEFGNNLPKHAESLAARPGVSNFIQDVKKVWGGATTGATEAASPFVRGSGVTGQAKSQRVATSRAARGTAQKLVPSPAPVAAASTMQNGSTAAVRQVQPSVVGTKFSLKQHRLNAGG